jgi:hypothetical protein
VVKIVFFIEDKDSRKFKTGCSKTTLRITESHENGLSGFMDHSYDFIN